MSFWKIITENAEAVAAIFGFVTSATVFLVKGKKYIIERYKKHKEYSKSKYLIPETLQEIKQCVVNLDDRIKRVEYEISPNSGGSMKDSMNIVKAEIEAMFWLNPKPSFRTTSKGVNIQVNEAYCHLCSTTSEDLLRQNWKNFIDNGDQLDDFMRRWEYSTNTTSQYSGKLTFKNSMNENLGEWIVKIRPLGPIEGGKEYLWHGSLVPSDNKAREYAKEYNIPYH